MSADTILGLLSSLVMTIIGIILGIFGNYYFWHIGKKEKEPSWSLKGENLIHGKISQKSGLEISYQGQKVESLTISRLYFWNNGAETIRGSDVVKTDPIRIVAAENVLILDTSILCLSEVSNQISANLHPDKSHVDINFEYLDKGQGAIFQVVHTGESPKYLSMAGKLIGSKPIFYTDVSNIYSKEKYDGDKKAIRRNLYIYGAMSLPSIIISFIGTLYLSNSEPSFTSTTGETYVTISVLIVIIITLLTIVTSVVSVINLIWQSLRGIYVIKNYRLGMVTIGFDKFIGN